MDAPTYRERGGPRSVPGSTVNQSVQILLLRRSFIKYCKNKSMIGNKCKNIISYLSILTNVRGLVGQTQRGADARQVSSNSIYLYAYFRT